MNIMNEKCKNGEIEYILELSKMVNDNSSKGVQDAISAMHCKGINLNNVKPNVKVWWHHSQEYYERRNAKKKLPLNCLQICVVLKLTKEQ